ncbi:MAG: hypothetical protein ABR599_03940, partial [Gemmatimonadota bacterium]
TAEPVAEDGTDEASEASSDEVPEETSTVAEAAPADCPLDRATIEATMGGEGFEEPEMNTQEDGFDCTFIRKDQLGSIAVSVMSSSAAYPGIAATMPDAEPVSGIGDKALYSPGITRLISEVDGKTLAVQLISVAFSTEEARTKAIALGRAAAERL